MARQLRAQTPWRIQPTAEHLAVVTQNYIPRLEGELYGLLARLQQDGHLGIRKVNDMACRQRAKTLQGYRRRLDTVTHPAQDGQADRLHAQTGHPCQMRGGAAQAVACRPLQQAELGERVQGDTKTCRKIPQHLATFRLWHECWPRRIPQNHSGRGRGASSAACLRHTTGPSIVLLLRSEIPQA